jgi:hypothetical protein
MVPLAAMWWSFAQIFRQKVTTRRRRARPSKARPALSGAA